MAVSNRNIPPLNSQDVTRFWSKVNKSSNQGPDGTCWQWIGGLRDIDSPYGCFSICNSSFMSHRVSYFLTFGIDPVGWHVLHRCDNPPCVNPEHLWLGTDADNARDMCTKGRQATGDRSSARLHPDKHARGDKSGARRHPERLRRGQSHPRSRFTNAEVISIRRRFKQGVRQSEMAREYNVDFGAIRAIVRYQTWKHLP